MYLNITRLCKWFIPFLQSLNLKFLGQSFEQFHGLVFAVFFQELKETTEQHPDPSNLFHETTAKNIYIYINPFNSNSNQNLISPLAVQQKSGYAGHKNIENDHWEVKKIVWYSYKHLICQFTTINVLIKVIKPEFRCPFPTVQLGDGARLLLSGVVATSRFINNSEILLLPWWLLLSGGGLGIIPLGIVSTN